jgi:hypothetical protein
MAKRKKYCPLGVSKDCLFCIRGAGKKWSIIDPRGESIDQADTKYEAISVAENYIASCGAARSGYGRKPKKVTFAWKPISSRQHRT